MHHLKYGPKRSDKLRWIYDRDKGICHLCHEFVPWEEASRDHIIPKWVYKRLFGHKGGGKTTNIKLAHRRCNVERDQMDVVEYQKLKGYTYIIIFSEQTNRKEM